jgi:hypothetical protein
MKLKPEIQQIWSVNLSHIMEEDEKQLARSGSDNECPLIAYPKNMSEHKFGWFIVLVPPEHITEFGQELEAYGFSVNMRILIMRAFSLNVGFINLDTDGPEYADLALVR